MIKCIIFDVDDTLMDYHQAESSVLKQIFYENGKTADQNVLDELWKMSWYYWDRERLSQTWDEEIQREYHVRYHRSMLAFTEAIRQRFELKMSARTIYERFIALMKNAATLYNDALPVIRELAKDSMICIATNSIAEIQMARLACIEEYVSHVFCSESLGAIKPMPSFFAQLCKKAGVVPADCLMVGDSLTSDIRGAQDAGMRTCWLNRSGRTNETPVKPHYEIRSLNELLPFKCKGGGKNDDL